MPLSSIARPVASKALVVSVGLLALIATACGGSTGTEATPAEATTTPASDASEAAAPSPLSGQFDTVEGSTVDLADFEGDNVVMWFWEPW